MVGSVIETALISLALADKVRLGERAARHRIENLNKDLKAESLEVKRLNENLEGLVDQKTRDIRSILKHIHQGIFTISQVKENTLEIGEEYSAFLSELLGKDDIAHKEPIEHIFSKSNLSLEEVSNIRSILSISLDEGELSFEANEHNLPVEMIVDGGNGQTIIEIDWNCVVDDDEQIEKMLIALRDVTHIRQLQLESTKQSEETRKLIEIAAIDPQDYIMFMSATDEFLEENTTILSKSQKGNMDAINQMFRNLHTIKGLARNYGLTVISSLTHEVEQVFQDTRTEKTPYDHESLTKANQRLDDEVKEFQRIAREKLGRDQSVNQVTLDSDTLDKWCNQGLSLVRNADVTDWKFKLERILSEMRRTYSMTLSDLLQDDILASRKLASDLGKESPEFHFDDKNMFLNKQKAKVLKSTFVHLIRNAIDHSLETAEERLENSKLAHGKIHLEIEAHPSEFDRWVILFYDDGRGVWLEKLHQKAVTAGLIDSDRTYSVDQILDVMFAAGLSTKDQLSEISGRGVGMDAVRAMLAEEGATIRAIPVPTEIRDSYANTSLAYKTESSHAAESIYVKCLFEIEVPSSFFDL
ncbi:MAG: Hpt domain-containing protein [Pseudobacteriovorax sp.]|nr:Hpt domain-containing protein [Pseudobacteriovorax sp.]